MSHSLVRRLAALAAVLLAPIAGAAPLEIVCTTGMVADAVRTVAGDRARVVSIMQPGIDPHLYQPTRGDVLTLMRADAIFVNGLMLEGKMGDLLARVGSADRPVFAVAERLDAARLMQGEGGHPDPHVWMDPALWAEVVVGIAESLTSIDPAGAEGFAARAAAHRAEIDRLGAAIRAGIATVPEPQRVLVTAHDAFGYFGRAYGVEVRGIQGISTESEAGVRDVVALVDFLVARDIRAVFVETTIADKNVRALVEGAAARGHAVRIGGSLYSDSMGTAGTAEGTWLGMIDHNATTIIRALGGTAPERGFLGRLTERSADGG